MADFLDKLIYKLEADLSGFKKSMAEGQRLTSRTSAKMKTAFNSIGSRVVDVTKKFFNWQTALATVAGNAGLGLLAKRSLAAAQVLRDVADRTDFNVEKLQSLRFAFEQNGVTIANTDAGLRRFTRRLGLAAEGTGPTVQAYKDLGIAVIDTNGKIRSSEDVFDDVVKALSKMESQAERSAAASAFFGEDAGPALAPLLGKGISVLKDYENELRRTGSILSNELVRKAGDAGDKIDSLGTVIKASFQAGFLDGFVDEIDNFSDIIKDPEFQKGIKDLGEGLGVITGWMLKAPSAIASVNRELSLFKGFVGDSLETIMLLRLGDLVDQAQDLQKKINQLGGTSKAPRLLVEEFDRVNESIKSLQLLIERINIRKNKALEEGLGSKSQFSIPKPDTKNLDETEKEVEQFGFNIREKLENIVPKDFILLENIDEGTNERFARVSESLRKNFAIDEILKQGKFLELGMNIDGLKERFIAFWDAMRQQGVEGDEIIRRFQELEKATDPSNFEFEISGGADGLAKIVEQERTLNSQLEYQKKLKEEQVKLDEKAKSLRESLKSDLEILLDKEQEIFELRQKDVITTEEYNKAIKKLNEEYDKLHEKTNDLKDVTTKLSDVIGTAFEDAIIRTKDFNDILRALFEDILRMIIRIMVTRPLQQGLEALFTAGIGALGSVGNAAASGSSSTPVSIPAAKGAAFDSGGTKRFAKGGVVSEPVKFKFARGVGLMGEAGPEGILPLARNSRGELGVKSSGGSGGQTILIDARGSNSDEGVFRIVQKAIETATPYIIQGSVMKVVSERQRNPKILR